MERIFGREDLSELGRRGLQEVVGGELSSSKDRDTMKPRRSPCYSSIQPQCLSSNGLWTREVCFPGVVIRLNSTGNLETGQVKTEFPAGAGQVSSIQAKTYRHRP